MSLTSLLLGKEAPVDKELDSLFQTPTAKVAISGPSKDIAVKKRKLEIEKETTIETLPKRSKSAVEELSKLASKPSVSKRSDRKPGNSNKTKKPSKPTKGKGKATQTDEDEDDEDLEHQYPNKTAPASEQRDEESNSDEEGDPSIMVHESVKESGKKARTAKSKYVPETETLEKKNLRTIFVGNLPLEVASKKFPLKKQLQRHILSFLPTAKIESIRFRSIPFQDGKSSKPSKKEPRQHEKERASVWRSRLDEKDEEGLKKDEERFLNPAQKKKIAFINQEFHSTADTVNAYIVFAHPPNTEGRPANLPPLPPTMDPYEASRAAADKCDGTLLMERMICVDLVEKDVTRSNDATDNTKHISKSGTDPRLSIFIGNLDFASKEEDLRVFFEGVGEPAQEADPQIKKPATWVTRLGKGFAYVQFLDRECVDELLALEESKLKFAKRKLRIQRCKTIPGFKEQVPIPNQKKKTSAPVAIPILKGDPNLGERLAGLSKDERKEVKSSDADRVARRLAKKKARMAMKPGIGKSKPKGKERKRVRS
ncbi:hypothetical protein CPB84DRAFT_1775032 [Gymnopilus junonius]|uniref:Nucleolar protein 12 n=1 Tax=Gymnopilus junonius TaxID=109634 RepID=A0A9P5NQU3_GYMJU|nr:hypothetical protein CPB84DRAFT_1775032 [Gymnopilus junonius]